MNKRIKELAEQVDKEFNSPYDRHKAIERFALLIVRECAQVCNNIDVEYEGEDVLANWCASAIKEHFGIEE
jgi:hypothetical protein